MSSSINDIWQLSAVEIKKKLNTTKQNIKEIDNIAIAAVLIPLFQMRNQWQVLFIHRSNWVDKHKDQVSFPGGMAEQGDKDEIATALRETREELGIPSGRISVIGHLQPMVFRNEYRIYPIVGEIPCLVEITPSEAEVNHAFSIPLKWLANPRHYALKDYKQADGQVRQVYFYRKYHDELLWGISAYIMVQLIEKLR